MTGHDVADMYANLLAIEPSQFDALVEACIPTWADKV